MLFIDSTMKGTKNQNTEVELQLDFKYFKKEFDDLKSTIGTEFAKTNLEIGKVRQDIKDGYVTKFEFNSIVERIGKLEGTVTWVVRTIIGSVILAALGLIFTK